MVMASSRTKRMLRRAGEEEMIADADEIMT